MSPVSTFGVLAFATAALAVPRAHDHQHVHLHHEARAGTYGESSAPAYGGSSVSPASDSTSSSSLPPYPVTSSSGAAAWPTGYPYPSGGSWGATGTGWGTGNLSPTGWYPSSAISVSPEASTCTAESTQIWRTKTTSIITIMVSPSRAPTGYEASAGLEAAACTPDTTVTTTITTQVTITAGAASSSTSASVAPESYSPEDTSTTASSSVAAVSESSAPAYSAGSTTPTSAPASYPAAGTSSAAPSQVSSAQSQASSESLSLSNIAGSLTSATSGLTGGKRGLAYNTASYVTPFIGLSNIGFAYNWVSNSAGLDSGIPYIPELHDMSEEFTSVWMSDAQTAIDNGAEYLFGFNEPDIASQANLSPAAAAAGWKTYMEPFKGKAKLVAPAVSNSGEAGQGLSWLTEFFAACDTCHFDAINLHWYDYTSNDISSLQSQITTGASEHGLPVFLGEFGFIGSDAEISSALSTAMAWLESEDNVLGYAYYYLEPGFLLDGTTPSAYALEYLS